MAYINQESEAIAQANGWTYESGYNQGFNMAYAGEADNNYFPKFSQAWHGHKAGYKDGKKAWKRGYR